MQNHLKLKYEERYLLLLLVLQDDSTARAFLVSFK